MPALSNANILVTRPQGQSDSLLAQLHDVGAQTLHCPVIEIQDQHQTPDNLTKIARLKTYQAAVFISQNAVEYGLRLLRAANIATSDLPLICATGRSTAALLEKNHIHVAACPAVPNSQALAETPAIQALTAGSRVLIFRGKGGKEVLAQTFAARGIDTEYAEVYQRIKPPNVTVPVTTLDGKKLNLIMLTSHDSLQNLYALTLPQDRHTLLEIPLLLGSEAMLDLVTEFGFKHPPIIAPSPLDEDMIAQAISWWQNYGKSAVQ